MRIHTPSGGIAQAQSLAKFPCDETILSIVDALFNESAESVVPTHIMYDFTSSVTWITIAGEKAVGSKIKL